MLVRVIALFLLFCLPGRQGLAALLTLELVPRWGATPVVVPSGALRNQHGQVLRVTRLAGLVSGVTLLRADGGTVRLEGQYGVIDAERGRISVPVRGVPPGNYAGLQFSFGLPEAVNHSDPGRWPAGHALNPLVNGLHWSWQGGYVFLAVEGRWHDASAEGAGERGFSYHLAGDERLMTMRFLAPFDVEAHVRVELALDLARVLRSRLLSPDDGSESTHSAQGDLLAPRVAHAVERAFFWLGAAEVESTDAASPGTAQRTAGPAPGAKPLAFVIPRGFPQPSLPADNPLTVEGVALGRALFFDRRLSGNGRQSCASCHEPRVAFSDTVAFSRGATGPEGRRNSMPLFNLAWSPNFAWDGGRPRVRDQALAAMRSPVEMHAEPAGITERLADDPRVVDGFAAAFGSRDVTPERLGLALEQYLLTLVSGDSRFDRALRGEATLSDEETRGFELFITENDPARGRRGADCFHCHGGPLLTDYGLKNNGLDPVSDDEGRADITGRRADRGRFKTPSLRNVALTAPYMHDGRFATIEDVVAHYASGVKRHENLDPNLAKHPDGGVALNADDQRALAAFLRTLTDEAFVAAAAGAGERIKATSLADASGYERAESDYQPLLKSQP